MDLHLHTPASGDYKEENVTYLDVLQTAERQGLDIIAFTDHNTVAGYRTMRQEIESLSLLESLGRLEEGEKLQLEEYRRLGSKILVLPGFEFTATLGFHILGIFSPDMDVREIEFILMQLNVPPDRLDAGTTEAGATTDVLTAYRLIDAAGGIVIAAHANTTHGVAMMRMGFGGQTRIAYTQDLHLHALEVTDLESNGRRTTARFFDGSRPEYPRRMRCIQGSDSHRLSQDPKYEKQLGIGDRVTEVLLPEVKFSALRDVFLASDFSRTRPATKAPVDYIQASREEGATIVQEFHEGYTRRGGRLYAILADICAFANTNGGTIYIGASPDVKQPPVGVNGPSRVIESLESEVERRITPPLDVTLTVQESNGLKLIQIVVPRGVDVPYAIDDSKIYVRSESETGLAVRDEIVNLVARTLGSRVPGEVEERHGHVEPPRTGVEVMSSEERKGATYHTLRDLRNSNVVKNVTRKSARRLWHYAITQVEDAPVDVGKVEWRGDIGVLKRREHGRGMRFDLVQRDGDTLRRYYGVTEDGIHGAWAGLVGLDSDGKFGETPRAV
ncbi:MAG: putative DNA binding domain-containing protein [Anaerolineae bacterium]|nr:putative DNA binding domain-containing protein [Anaerolineae bacterium]